MATDTLQNITTGFDGSMAVIAKTAGVYGGTTGEVFAASFGIMNGVITGVISFEGSAQTRTDLEKAVVGVGAGYLADIFASAAIKWSLGILIGVEAAAASPVLIVGAGAAAILAGIYGDDIYNMYTDAQNSFFKWLTDSNVSFDTSLDRFLFLEGADLNEEELNNLINAYNKDNPAGHQTNYNPFTSQMSDPLVIDADKDGFISTVSLADSEVYFDLTGNGVKTKTSWVKGNDAILVYDENEDGQISGIEEVFGNATTSGFDELRDTIDSNHDNKIDRRDILFNRLQLWHDYDQDGVVDEGELKSLKDIATIDLNSVQTTIDLEGTILTEASHYTDTTGNKELAADLELQYMPKVDSTISAGNAGSIDVDTIFLPQLRGYGYVANSLLSYNSDASLKELATKYANNIDLVANHFDLVANHFDEFVAKTIFTCKTFTTNKALHVKIQNTLKGVNDGAEKMVA